jgi:hypothetical protein
VTFFNFNGLDRIFYDYQRTTGTNADTKTTSLAFIPVYYGHFSHYLFTTSLFLQKIQPLSATFLSSGNSGRFPESRLIGNNDTVAVHPDRAIFFQGLKPGT